MHIDSGPTAVSAVGAGGMMPAVIYARRIGQEGMHGVHIRHREPTVRLGGVVVSASFASAHAGGVDPELAPPFVDPLLRYGQFVLPLTWFMIYRAPVMFRRQRPRPWTRVERRRNAITRKQR